MVTTKCVTLCTLQPQLKWEPSALEDASGSRLWGERSICVLQRPKPLVFRLETVWEAGDANFMS